MLRKGTTSLLEVGPFVYSLKIFSKKFSPFLNRSYIFLRLMFIEGYVNLERLQRQEEVRDILTALMELYEKYRTVLTWYLIYEKTIPEIAAEFQMRYDTVQTRYRRGI